MSTIPPVIGPQSENELPQGSIPLTGPVPRAGSVPLDQSAEPAHVQVNRPPIEFELPNGLKIKMEIPKASISLSLANILAEENFVNPGMAEIERNRIRSLLYISEIDNEPVMKISDQISRRALEQRIGDENLDAIFIIFMEQFPQTDPRQIKIVKKY